MAATHADQSQYRPQTIWTQLRSREDGEWFQAVRWQGLAWEHQKGHRTAVFHRHPFFAGIGVEGLGDRCYLQMMGQPQRAQ